MKPTQQALLSVFVLTGVAIFAQTGVLHLNAPLDEFSQRLSREILYAPEHKLHTAVKPILQNHTLGIYRDDTLHVRATKTEGWQSKWLGRKLLSESLLQVEDERYRFYIDPLMDFGFGNDRFAGRSTYQNTRGAQVYGQLGSDFAFYSSFFETQNIFPEWIDAFSRERGIAPGWGRVKPFGDFGFDYAMANGYVSYTPSSFFNIQFGHDKHFWGDGYRSLFLSDNAFNFPFLKVSTQFWNIQYTNLFASFQDIGNAANSVFGGYPKKFATFHHLSWNVTPRFNIGLFETVVWQNQDSTGQRRGFDVNYLNPVIFYRPVEYGLGSPDNVLIGFSFKYLPLKRTVLYGQLILDEFLLKEVRERSGWWANKQGFQLGVNQLQLLGIPHLQVRAEYNYVRPYTYSHFNGTQSYTHFGQPLAHPLGANFTEWVFEANYQWKRWGIALRQTQAIVGLDTLDAATGQMLWLGQNIFPPIAEQTIPSAFGNAMHQGLKTQLHHTRLAASYLINPKYNLRFELQLWLRTLSNVRIEQNMTFVSFGLRTNLPNRTWDF